MKIELTPQQMQTLLASGLLHPNEIACLDIETRNQLKKLCLKLCQPSHCARCEMNSLCQQSFENDVQSQPLKSVMFVNEQNQQMNPDGVMGH